jgi:dTMP kinase
MRMLAERLRALGCNVLESVEPGGTPIGLQVRRILLDPANRELRPTTELLLMFAARAQNVEEWIIPALTEGRIVLSDRFTDSSVTYQGVGRGLGIKTVLEVDRIACHGVVPDLTLVIDIDENVGVDRAHRRNRARQGTPESRIDEEELEFHRRVRAAYHELAEREPDRIRVINGNAAPDAIAGQVWSAVEPVLADLSVSRFSPSPQSTDSR